MSSTFSLSILTQTGIKDVPTLPSGQNAVYIQGNGVPGLIGDLDIIPGEAGSVLSQQITAGFSYASSTMGGIIPALDTTIGPSGQGTTISGIKYVAIYFAFRGGQNREIAIIVQASGSTVAFNQVYDITENGWRVQANLGGTVTVTAPEGDPEPAYNLWILATVTGGNTISLNQSQGDDISFNSVSGADLAGVPQMFITSNDSVPLNCLGPNTPIVTTLEGDTTPIKDLSETNVVTRDKKGNRRLVKGKVYRTTFPTSYRSISINTSFGEVETSPTHLLFTQDPAQISASINTSKCKRQCKLNNIKCARCTPFFIGDYESVVAEDLVKNQLATEEEKSGFLYHIILPPLYKKYAFELGDGSILSESFRHQYGERESDQHWMEN